jgi:hypothetical protein
MDVRAPDVAPGGDPMKPPADLIRIPIYDTTYVGVKATCNNSNQPMCTLCALSVDNEPRSSDDCQIMQEKARAALNLDRGDDECGDRVWIKDNEEAYEKWAIEYAAWRMS